MQSAAIIREQIAADLGGGVASKPARSSLLRRVSGTGLRAKGGSPEPKEDTSVMASQIEHNSAALRQLHTSYAELEEENMELREQIERQERQLLTTETKLELMHFCAHNALSCKEYQTTNSCCEEAKTSSRAL